MTTNIHKTLDILFVTDNLHELYNKVGPTRRIIDKENKPTRPNLYKKTKGLISLKEKWQANYDCFNESHNDDNLATYGKKLLFLGNNKKNIISQNEFWITNINTIKKKNDIIGQKIKSINPENSYKINYFFTTHHNRIKKTIFENVLDKKNKRHFANCCCIKISSKTITDYTGEKIRDWEFEFLFEGFPDKKEYKYFKKGVWNKNTEGIIWDNLDDLKDTLNDIYDEDNTSLNNITIYIVRHGNALHNLPLKITGKGIKQVTNLPTRTVDSTLTPLGIQQALELKTKIKDELKSPTSKNINVFFASNLNRAQHTMLLLIPQSNHYKNLIKLRELFTKMAYFRFERKIKNAKLDFDKTIKKFENSLSKIKLNTKEIKRVLKYKKPYLEYLTKVKAKKINIPSYPKTTNIAMKDNNGRVRVKGNIVKRFDKLGGKTRRKKTRRKKRKKRKKTRRKKTRRKKY